jgi:glycosyltransferase involved in cell wall biosynthesis
MNDKVSIVIRNKNESNALATILSMLNSIYSEFIKEIIIVDNNSIDDSLDVASTYKCKIVSIDNFSYGRAINYGIEAADSNYILLLSSHAMPIGKHFFFNALDAIKKDSNIAGIRFINSFDNYKRAYNNNFIVNEPLEFGLMAACCIVNKNVWLNYKFNEDLVACEDKEWSFRVMKGGYRILDLNETYYYFINRAGKSLIKRYRNETLAYYQLNRKKYPSLIKIMFSSLKKIIVTNFMSYLNALKVDLLIFVERIKLYGVFKKHKNW